MDFKKLFSIGQRSNPRTILKDDWRALIEKPCSSLNVGGFRPSGNLTSSCFGEIRASLQGEAWPEYNGEPLWPVCQLNLSDAPFVPAALADVAMLQVFVSGDFLSSDFLVVNSREKTPNSPFFIRCYGSLEQLQRTQEPNHTSTFKAFEAQWTDEILTDYPTHDTMPIDFDALGIGEYYEQEGVEGVMATKLGGWPICIQSEPWWDYRKEGREFEFALQVDSEPKANCWWGDAGTVYIARHKSNKNLWAIDIQFH